MKNEWRMLPIPLPPSLSPSLYFFFHLLFFQYLCLIYINTELLLVGCYCNTVYCMAIIVDSISVVFFIFDFLFWFPSLKWYNRTKPQKTPEKKMKLKTNIELSWRYRNPTFCHDSVPFRHKLGWILDMYCVYVCSLSKWSLA